MSRLKHWMAGAVPLVLLAACPLALRAQTAGCYTLASLQGDWAVIGSYGANVGVELGVRSLDGKGNLTSSFVLNRPVQGSATGARTTATGTQRGTYTVNCDGTGQFKRTLTLADGTTATGVDDFLITAAVIQNGQAVATAIADAQQTSSTIVPGGVFLTRTHTARPAGGCYTLASLQGTYGVSVGYGANLALGLQPEILDGKGNLSRTGINNQLVAGTTTGERTITKVTSNGTYTVNCNGMGVINRVVTRGDGTTAVTSDDFVITGAIQQNGQLIATSIVDAQRDPSVVPPGGLFVLRTHTLRPAIPSGPVLPPPPPSNQTVAVAGPKNAVTFARAFLLDGTQSTSADGKPLAYLWTLAPGSPAAAILAAATATPTVQFTLGHTVYTFQLTVTDSSGGVSTDLVSVSFQGN